MKNSSLIIIFFIVVSAFKTHENNTNKEIYVDRKPPCGIMVFNVANNTSSSTVGMLYVTYPGNPVQFTVNYSPGQSGEVGSTQGSAGTLFSIKVTVTGGCSFVRLTGGANGTLNLTKVGQPTSAIYIFQNIGAACAVYNITVEE